MTPLPKRKHSTRRQGKRRAAIKMSLLNFSRCPNCGELKTSHRVCPKCGFYKSKEIIKPRVKKTKTNK